MGPDVIVISEEPRRLLQLLQAGLSSVHDGTFGSGLVSVEQYLHQLWDAGGLGGYRRGSDMSSAPGVSVFCPRALNVAAS